MARIELRKRGPIGEIRLNRPEVLNALGRDWPDDMLAAAREMQDDAAIRVVLVTGEGRAFCSGLDLTHLAAGEIPNPWFHQAELSYRALETLDKPVIAGVQGHCIGGGLQIIDPESGERLPDGEIGELVLTAATKEAFPVLRYRTRDRTRLTRERCACGRTMARMLEILGRTDDMLIVRGVNVFPSQIEHALLGVDGLAPHYQIVLTTRADRQDELRVRIEAAAGHGAEAADRAGLEARAREVLRGALGLAVVAELVAARTLPRSEGKAIRVLDERRK